MKRKILCLTLAIVMLTSCAILLLNVEVSGSSDMGENAFTSSFSDVSETHWAISYINAMKNSDIINGYEDGTFKPEQEVKHGEFIKMVVMCRWPIHPTEELPEGTHWATPYAKLANDFIIYYPAYNYEKYESYITREEAVNMIWKLYCLIHQDTDEDITEKYIKQYADEATIIDEDSRYYFNACIQYGLINGYEDGTLRPNYTLTRAQATKLLYVVLHS